MSWRLHQPGRGRALARWLLIALVACLGLPAAANADPLTYSSLSPPDHASFAYDATIIWDMLGAKPSMDDVEVRVAYDSSTSSDGTLVNLAGLTALSETWPGGTGHYVGSSEGTYYDPWRETPGTYYWQVVAVDTDTTVPFLPMTTTYVGDVRSLTIEPPLVDYTTSDYPDYSSGGSYRTTTRYVPSTGRKISLRMRLSEARRYARAMIAEMTHRRWHQLKGSCTRLSSKSFRCKMRWYDGHNWVYAGRGFFGHVERSGTLYVEYSFAGSRASIRCVRSHGGRVGPCVHRYRWPRRR